MSNRLCLPWQFEKSNDSDVWNLYDLYDKEIKIGWIVHYHGTSKYRYSYWDFSKFNDHENQFKLGYCNSLAEAQEIVIRNLSIVIVDEKLLNFL